MTNSFDTIDPKMLARIQALRLMDDDFMSVVFEEDIKLTEFLLRILLRRNDLHVDSVMTQKEKRNIYGRSVKLDILAKDTSGKVYNVEIQRADKGASPKRVRYNLAMLDNHILQKRDDFDKLPETYIIFITENDYYGFGQPFYEIRKTVHLPSANSMYLPFEDGCNIIYVNGAYRGNDAIGRLMHDFCTPNTDDMNYSELAEKVRYHKQETKGVTTMCRIVEEYGDERAAEGRAEGAKQTAIENAKNLLKEGDSPEKIARCCSLPLEQVLALKEELARELTTAGK